MLVFLVNPNAGGERGYRVFKKLERRLLRTKTEYQVYVTGGTGEARQLAAKLTEAPGDKELTLVAVGGDGMLNEVLDGARLSEKLRFGFIPVGRDSDFARGLKLPVTPLGCLKRILAPREERSLDYGVVEFGGNASASTRSGCPGSMRSNSAAGGIRGCSGSARGAERAFARCFARAVPGAILRRTADSGSSSGISFC